MRYANLRRYIAAHFLFEILRTPNLRRYSAALFLLWFGATVFGGARVWSIYKLTRSIFMTVLLETLTLVPQVALSLAAGRVQSAAGRRLRVIHGLTLQALVALVMAAFAMGQALTPWLFIGLSIVGTWLMAWGSPAFSGLFADAAGSVDDRTRQSLVAERQSISLLASVAAGLTLTALARRGPELILPTSLILGVSQALAAWFLFRLNLGSESNEPAAASRERAREVLQEAFSHRDLVFAFAIASIGLILLRTQPFMPAYFSGLLGSGHAADAYFQLRLLGQVMGIAALAMTRYMRSPPLVLITLWVFTAWDCLMQAVFPLLSWTWMSLAYAFMWGASEIAGAAFFAILQYTEGSEKRGVYFGVWRALTAICGLLGLLVGALASRLGPGRMITLSASGGLFALAVIYWLWRRGERDGL